MSEPPQKKQRLTGEKDDHLDGAEEEEKGSSSGGGRTKTTLLRDVAALVDVVSSHYLSATYADALIDVRGTKLPSHALLLSSWSRTFSRDILAATTPGRHQLVVGVDVGSVARWKEVLRFFYTSEICLSSDNSFEVLEIAIRYEIDALSRLCQHYILSSATSANSCLFLERSQHLMVTELANKLKYTIFAQLEKARHTEGFLRLPFEVLREWVSSDDMGISELVIFDAILSWAKGDIESRKLKLVELLPLVRYPRLDSKTLASMKQRDEPILDDPEIATILNPLIYEALLYNAAPELTTEEMIKLSSPRFQQRHQLISKFHFTKQIVTFTLMRSGVYRIKAKGAKAADGKSKKGGHGAIISASFRLQAGTILHILVGGMSTMRDPDSGGGGGTFIAIDVSKQPLLVAGGGGGTRGKPTDFDGKDANLDEPGRSGAGTHKASGGPKGKQGKTAHKSYGGGGAGFYGSAEGPAGSKSFLEGGEGGEHGGFGGGGGVGNKGGGGGGGYSGGGGGQGGGGGGSFVRADGFDVKKKVGCTSDGMAKVRYLGSY